MIIRSDSLLHGVSSPSSAEDEGASSSIAEPPMEDRDAIIAHYRRMSDVQFTYCATRAFGIKPEALPILR
jgi:hypothetical protein